MSALQLSHSSQLQEKLEKAESDLTAATAQLQQVQSAQHTMSEELKRQRDAWGEEQAAHTQATTQVGCLDQGHASHIVLTLYGRTQQATLLKLA